MVGGTHVTGTHAFAWVTSVNPDHAIKIRHEPCWGFLLQGTHRLPKGKESDSCRKTLVHPQKPSEPALTLAWIVCHAFPTPERESILGRADGKQPFCRGGESLCNSLQKLLLRRLRKSTPWDLAAIAELVLRGLSLYSWLTVVVMQRWIAHELLSSAGGYWACVWPLSRWGRWMLLEEVSSRECPAPASGSETSWSGLFMRPREGGYHWWTMLVKVYTPGLKRHVGNESPWVVVVRRHLGKNPSCFLCCFPCNLSLA